MDQNFGKRWRVVHGFAEIQDPDTCLRIDPRFRAKGHADERFEKNLVFGLSGFQILGIQETEISCNRNSEIMKHEVPFNSDHGHHRWLHEERA
jgi:hypothetical protein